jgi:alpha-glucosidase
MVDAPLSKLPLFVKKNTILPWGNKVMHVSDEPEKVMTFRLFGECGSTTHYQDNGLDFNYQQGEYNDYYVEVAENGPVTVELTKHGFKPVYNKIYVETDQRRCEFRFNAATEEYELVSED